jgi:hypothetical protein
MASVVTIYLQKDKKVLRIIVDTSALDFAYAEPLGPQRPGTGWRLSLFAFWGTASSA